MYIIVFLHIFIVLYQFLAKVTLLFTVFISFCVSPRFVPPPYCDVIAWCCHFSRGSQHDLNRDRSVSPDYYGSRRYRFVIFVDCVLLNLCFYVFKISQFFSFHFHFFLQHLIYYHFFLIVSQSLDYFFCFSLELYINYIFKYSYHLS